MTGIDRKRKEEKAAAE